MEDRYAVRMIKALERIADALEAANANDPLTAIGKAMEAETQANVGVSVPPEWVKLPDPPEWMSR